MRPPAEVRKGLVMRSPASAGRGGTRSRSGRWRCPDRVEPAPAAGAVAPALGEPALGVVAEEDVVRPLLVGERGRVLRVRDAGLAAVVELDLLAGAAPRTFDELHGCSLGESVG